MKAVKRFLHLVDATNEWIGDKDSWLIVVILGIVVIEVVARYVFSIPLIWPHETSTFIFGAYFMLGGGYILLHRGHVNIDILHQRLSQRMRAIVDLGTAMFFFLFCGLLLWQSAEMGWHSLMIQEKTQSVWAPPVYPIKIIVPIAAFLLLTQGLAKFIRDLRIAIGGKQPEGASQ